MVAQQDVEPPSEPIRSAADLVEVFRSVEKPVDRFRIGAEAEKFGIFPDGSPLPYAGPRGVEHVFEALGRFGWEPEQEAPSAPTIALRRGSASITLEPGSQFELSGAALSDLHQVAAEFHNHLHELAPVSRELGLTWLGVGFHPLAPQEALTWVPKQRYAIMREYLPPLGSAAHDMMRRTATVQANFDFASEADAMKKLMVALKLSPLIHAMLANAPLKEGRVTGHKSLRGEVWLNMDASRSGLIPSLWTKREPRYLDYVEWALDSGMFLFKRAGQVIANTGQTFRSFMQDGYQGHHATLEDFKLHLQTLFPEARLKNTLEVRACDSLPAALSMAVPALFTGILYDARALEQATQLVASADFETVSRERPALVSQGLAASFAGKPALPQAQQLYDIAASGLSRRGRRSAQNEDERRYLKPLERLLQKGESPADDITRGLAPGALLGPDDVIARCRIA